MGRQGNIGVNYEYGIMNYETDKIPASINSKYPKQKGSAVISSFFFVILVFVDQAYKYFVHSIFKNYNFAFSLPVPVAAMYLVYTAVLFFMARYCVKNYKNFSFVDLTAWNLIFAGAISNIGERIILGYVRDWIHIYNGIFNLADGYIIAGIAILILLPVNIKKSD